MAGLSFAGRSQFSHKETFPKRKRACYMERHKLLSDDERETLPADAFEPVAYVPD